MSVALPEELLQNLQQQILLRQTQLEQLCLLYNPTFPSPKALVVYGTEDAYKLETIETALRAQKVQYVTINCRECLSQRHLLTKIFARCVAIHNQEEDLERYDRLESINALASNLRRLLHKRKEKLVLIVESVDQQRGATTTLLPAVTRLGDLIPSLAVILTTSSPRPLTLHKSGVQYIHFPPYKRNDAIQILLRDPPHLLPNSTPNFLPSINQDKLRKIYNQFATIVYDTLIAPTTNSISKYRQTCRKLWPRFIWPMLSGETPPGRISDWDFARLLSRSRSLFQAEGEEAIQERLLPIRSKPWTFEDLIAQKMKLDEYIVPIDPALQLQQKQKISNTSQSLFQPVQPPSSTVVAASTSNHETPLLKWLPTLILLSCYLASHTHQKHDIVLFSRLSNASSTSRRKRKYLARSRAGGISKSPKKVKSSTMTTSRNDDDDDDIVDEVQQTPTKKKQQNQYSESMTATTTPKKERADRSMRAIFEKTSNIARPFTLERLIAILRAIHPEGVKSGKGIADRVYVELGELERLRLVMRVDHGTRSAAAGSNPEDVVMEEKWKCVVSREWVVQAGKWYGLSIEGWEVVVD